MLYGSTSSQPVSRIPKACLRLQVSEPGTEEAFQGESLTSVQRSGDIARSLGWSIRLELTSLARRGGVIDKAFLRLVTMEEIYFTMVNRVGAVLARFGLRRWNIAAFAGCCFHVVAFSVPLAVYRLHLSRSRAQPNMGSAKAKAQSVAEIRSPNRQRPHLSGSCLSRQTLFPSRKCGF